MSTPTRWAAWIALSFSPSGRVCSWPLMMMVAMGVGETLGTGCSSVGSGGCLSQNRQGVATAGQDGLGVLPFEDRLLERCDLSAARLVGLDVLFQLGPELGHCVLDWPGRAVGEAADRGAGHRAHVVGELEHD